jgi:hypothetical protein
MNCNPALPFLQKRTTLAIGIFVEKFRDESCRPSHRPLRKGFLRRGYLGDARHSHQLTRYEDGDVRMHAPWDEKALQPPTASPRLSGYPEGAFRQALVLDCRSAARSDLPKHEQAVEDIERRRSADNKARARVA